MRSVEEWVGKTDDSRPPPRVRVRIFEKHGGRCHITGRLIRPGDAWDAEHIVALSLGGENRESNLAPALKEPHKVKSREERKVKARIDRIRRRHLGIRPASKFACARNSPWKKKINGMVVPR